MQEHKDTVTVTVRITKALNKRINLECIETGNQKYIVVEKALAKGLPRVKK